MKIVIADDSKVMRQIVSRTLRQAGFSGHDIVEATDGSHAHQVVIDEKPDLVLSDWNMPGMSGIELLQALRAGGVDVPFAFVTSEGSDTMRQLAAQAGAICLINKPFTADHFRDLLGPILG
jgi:two-component system chemotaxis response regulator CheY